ncbi:hypothetical protein [Pseudomonas cannabina]|uniref:hypothetical protein n=1 Tax=Pseudomonas cannabina TaxID=86840 RepID=UPI00070A6FA3|nr:hypothetical protein [Pseudomonas cannabina]
MTFELIRQYITARMSSFQSIDQDRIQYPNQPQEFITPATGLWCRLNIEHSGSLMAGMADEPYTRKLGAVIIQCFARTRTGIKGLNELADDIEKQFAYWSIGDLEFIEASQTDVGEKDGFHQINVRVRFRAG